MPDATPSSENKPTKAQMRAFQKRQDQYGPNALSKQQLEERVPVFVNYDYANWRDIWRSVRHAMIGEVEVKRHGAFYLPRPSGMDDAQFDAYKDRAVFYNMVYRTVVGLTGAVFRREPRVKKAGPKLVKLCQRVSKDGLSLTLLAKVTAQDLLATGRFGILADKAPEDGSGLPSDPYLAAYTAENILDWTVTDVEGRNEVNYVLLREFKTDRRLAVFEAGDVRPNANYGRFYVIYRVLRLTYNDEMARWEYHQEVYDRENADADLTEVPTITTPLVFGVPMKRIPFEFFNATTNLPDVEKPPILDILTLNIAHYKIYAQLQHARFYTANPVYYVSGAQEEDQYHIGPSVVWEIGTGQTAGIIEYKGQGLQSLEKGLDTIEEQAASIGGRMVGNSPNAGQSDNQIKLKDRNEQSLLLNVTTVMNENFTRLLKVLAAWINENADDIEFRCNQDFLLDGGDARQFRAIQQMYQAGILPVEVVYEYFLKEEVIPDYITLDQFTAMLVDVETHFPNQSDVAAMAAGYHDATDQMLDRQFNKTQSFTAEQNTEDRTHEADLQSEELDHEAQQAEQARKSSEKIAKNTPKIPAVPGQAFAANQHDPSGKGPPPAPAPTPAPGTPKPKPAAPKKAPGK